MGIRLRDSMRLAICGGISLLLLTSGVAFADRHGVILGLDLDDDLVCDDTNDLNIQGKALGDSVEVDIFWDNSGANPNIVAMNCVFCVQDTTAVSLDTFFFSPELLGAAGWQLTYPQSHLQFAVHVDQALLDSFPAMECWLVQTTDFSLAGLAAGPHLLGTLAFKMARPGNLGLHIDGDPLSSGWFAAGFLAGSCDEGQDPTCQCVNDGSVAVEASATWGEVKTLFR